MKYECFYCQEKIKEDKTVIKLVCIPGPGDDIVKKAHICLKCKERYKL